MEGTRLTPYIISSKSNPKIARWQKLQTKREVRHSEKAILIEGENLLKEILENHQEKILHIILREELIDNPQYSKLNYPTSILSQSLFKTISQVEESDGVILECRIDITQPSMQEIILNKRDRHCHFLILDQLQDPGNLGTLIRTAAAFNIAAIYCIQPSCDIWNPKVVRSGKGAHFLLPIIETSWELFNRQLEKLPEMLRPQCIGAFPPGKGTYDIKDYLSSKERSKLSSLALILGNEAHGIQAPKEFVMDHITIPMMRDVDSLNVAQAGAILLYLLFTQE